MRKIIQFLAGKPIVFNILRRIIEANYVSLKKVIQKEFSLDLKRGKTLSAEKLLDVPCGTGEFCMLFPPGCYYGLDISEKYIDYARKKYKRRFFRGDALRIGFDEAFFDKVLTLSLLHHIDDSSVKSVLKETKRILKPDGILLLIEDAPTRNKWNIVGKFLQKFDIGCNIRPESEYRIVLEQDFNIRRYYHVKSGFWDYSVFVLSLRQESH